MNRTKWIILLVVLTGEAILVTALIINWAQHPFHDVKAYGTMTAEASLYPLKLTMTLSATSLDLSESLDIAMSLRNTDNETLTLYFADGNDRFEYCVFNESGALVYRLDLVYPQIHAAQQLKPDETHNMTYGWAEIGQLIYQPDEEPPCYYEHVPVGTYYVKGQFISGSLRFTVETPYLMVKITSIART